jgi:hypothetical protein
MEVVVVITVGLVLMTLIAVVGDGYNKRRAAADPALEQRVRALEAQLAAVEAQARETDERTKQLGTEVAFVNRLLEKKD